MASGVNLASMEAAVLAQFDQRSAEHVVRSCFLSGFGMRIILNGARSGRHHEFRTPRIGGHREKLNLRVSEDSGATSSEDLHSCKRTDSGWLD